MRASATNVHQLPLSEDQAIAWLRAQGRVTVTAAELGRRWGWHRQRVGRRLRAWHMAGEIQWFEAEKTIVTPVTPVTVTVTPPSHTLPEPVTPPVTMAPEPVTPVTPTALPVTPVRRRGGTVKLLGCVLIFSGVGLGLLSFFINATGWSAFAKTASAGVTLAGLGLLFDLLAIVLPSCASSSKWRYASVLWGAWVIFAGTVFCTSIGFAYSNIGDSVQGRSASMDRRAVIQQRLVQWRRDRSEIPLFAHTKDEDVATAAASRVRECDIKRFCSKATETELKVRAHRGFTVRAEKLDTDIAALELELKELPIVASADPQIAGTLKVMSWVFLSPSEDLAAVIRLLIIAGCLSFFPGLAVTAGFDLLRS